MPLPCGHSWNEPPAEACAYCRVRDNPAHAKRWGGEPPRKCVHLGKPTESRIALNCHKDPPTRIETFACDVHGACTEAAVARDTHCCKHCTDNPDRKQASEILSECGSDKEAHHSYGQMYNELLKAKRPAVRNVLEIGVWKGDSIRAWRLMFPQAKITAVDIEPVQAETVAGLTRVEFVELDAGDPAALEAFAAANIGRFDLIVDDASHLPAHQVLVRVKLWPALAPDGVMVIEDICDEATALSLQQSGGREWDYRDKTGDPYSRCVSFVRKPEIPAMRMVAEPRVLFTSHDLSLTGAPIILANLIPHLRGIRPIVYSPVDGPLRSRFEQAGIPITHAIDLDVDLVVASTLLSANVVAIAKERGIPCVWMIHESDPKMCGNVRGVIESIDYPARVIFPCQATADAYSQWTAGRAAIVPSIVPPVPVRTQDPDPESLFYVATIGSNEPRKGQSDIRAAIEDLEDVGFMVLAGERNPHQFLQLAHLYVCSSRVEAFPLALQEAKAYGLPVITTPVFGCSEIIRDGIDGLHYRPGDVADLRAKIERIRTDPELRARLSQPLTHLPTFSESVAMYERVYQEALGRPLDRQPLRVVYHVAGMGPWWQAIVSEQFQQLAAAGLRDVLCTHVGEGLDWTIDEAARHGIRIVVCEHQPDVRNYEVPAMRLMERLARQDDTPILYLHGKGVSYDPATGATYHDWRRLMMRELIAKWREHLPNLATHDLVGVNWWDRYPHFSGNFWLARAEWIRRLPRFDEIHTDRYSCERWIGLAPRPRVLSLLCRNQKFWVAGEGMEVLQAAMQS